MRRAFFTISTVVLTALVAMPARGVSPKGKRRSVRFKEDKSMEVSKAELLKRAKANQRKAMSAIKYEDVIKRTKLSQIKKIGVLKQQERLLQRQVRLFRGRERQVEYLFRLADVYIRFEEIYKFWYGEMVERLSNTKNPAKRKKLIKKRNAYLKLQKTYLEKALKYLNSITSNELFQNWPRMDEVLYKQGDIARELGYPEIMREKFQKLLAQYPQSKFVPYAHLAFAEYYFKLGRRGLEKATYYYTLVVKNPRATGTAVHFYALRMLGWCHFNLSNFPKALGYFRKVAVNAKSKSLRKQALRDFVMTYAHSKANRARAYDLFYNKLGKDGRANAKELYVKLAQEYFSVGRFSDSVWVYEDLVRRFPQDKERCEWYHQIFTIYKVDQKIDKMAGALDKSVEVMKEMTKQFGEKDLAVRTCRNFVKRALIYQAKKWYAKVQKKRNSLEPEEKNKLLRAAAKMYQRFLEIFPKEDEAYDMRYDYADLLLEIAETVRSNGAPPEVVREAFKRAAEQYTSLLKWNHVPKGMTKKIFERNREDIGKNAVVCWMEVLGVDFQKSEKETKRFFGDYVKARKCRKAKRKAEEMGRKWRRKCPEVKKNLPIPGQMLAVIDVFDLYIKYVKRGKILPVIKYNKAMIYYVYRHFAKAIPLFKDTIFTTYRMDPDTAIQATYYLMVSYDVEERFEDMVDTITELLKPQYRSMFESSAKGKKLRTSLEAKKLHFMELEVEKRYDEGRYREAAELLMKMAKNFTSDPKKVVKYYVGASRAYEKAGLIGPAIRARVIMEKLYGRNSQTKKMKEVVENFLAIGQLFERIAYFDKAAWAYQKFFEKYPRDPDAVAAARRAVKLNWWAGNLSKAERLDKDFITKLYNMGGRKFAGDMASLFFMLHQFYEGRRGKESQVMYYLGKFIETQSRSGAKDLLLRAYAKRGLILWKQSCPVKPMYGICMDTYYVTKKTKTATWQEERIRFVPRDRSKVRAAVKSFKMAVKYYNQWKGGKRILGATSYEKPKRISEAINAAAMAKFYIAEAEYEKIISLEPPKIELKKIKKSMSQLKRWLGKMGKLMAKNKKLYEEVGKLKIGKKRNKWYVPAAGRFGAIFKNLYLKLKYMKFGKYIEKNIDLKFKIQDSMAGPMEEFQKKAITGFKACVKIAQKEGRYDEWYDFCEKNLAELTNAVSPLRDEVWAEPDYQKPVCTEPTIMTTPAR